MTHIAEKDFGDRVEQFLIDQFGSERVEREYVFDDLLRADFLVDGPLCRWAIELEKSAEKVREGLGQAIDYHRKAADLRPVVIVPKGHVDDTRYEAYRPYILILEFDEEEMELVDR